MVSTQLENRDKSNRRKQSRRAWLARSGEHTTQSQRCEFEPHVGRRDYVKIKSFRKTLINSLLKENYCSHLGTHPPSLLGTRSLGCTLPACVFIHTCTYICTRSQTSVTLTDLSTHLHMNVGHAPDSFKTSF